MVCPQGIKGQDEMWSNSAKSSKRLLLLNHCSDVDENWPH